MSVTHWLSPWFTLLEMCVALNNADSRDLCLAQADTRQTLGKLFKDFLLSCHDGLAFVVKNSPVLLL